MAFLIFRLSSGMSGLWTSRAESIWGHLARQKASSQRGMTWPMRANAIGGCGFLDKFVRRTKQMACGWVGDGAGGCSRQAKSKQATFVWELS